MESKLDVKGKINIDAMKDLVHKKWMPVFISFLMVSFIFSEIGYSSVKGSIGDPATDPLTNYPVAEKNRSTCHLSGDAGEGETVGIETPDRPGSLDISINDRGEIDISWEAVPDLDGKPVAYRVYRYSVENVVRGTKDDDVTLVYDGRDTACTDNDDDTWINGNRYRYYVISYATVTDPDTGEEMESVSPERYSEGGDGFLGDDKGIVYLSPESIYVHYDFLTANVGTKRVLRVNFKMTDRVRYANVDVPGYWTSTDPSVATIDQSGAVRAVAPGKCEMIFRALDGKIASCEITVPEEDTVAGSTYINYGRNHTHHEQILGLKRVVKGNKHRLNGQVVSQYKLKKVSVKFYKSNGKLERSYSRSAGGQTFSLQKYANYMPFDKLSYGDKTVRVYVTNSLGTAKVYEDDFTVAKRVSKKNWGKAVANLAQTRLGDPYSMGKRGYLSYTDCSYLVIWSYANAIDKYMPATAAEQYRYCVNNGKKLKYSQLQPGDLIFYGGPENNGRYKKINHVEIYLGEDQTVGAIYAGVTRRNIVRASDTDSKLYYGRPYK